MDIIKSGRVYENSSLGCETVGQRSDNVRRLVLWLCGKFSCFNWLMCLALAVALIVLSGCASSRGGSIPYGVEDFGRPDAPVQILLDSDYRIAPLDKLAVKVFQVDALSGDYQVDLTGNIALPLLGNVRAVDLTPVELQVHLAERLSAKYLNDPNVTVGITEATGSKITVDGSVREPGVFPVSGKTTLIQAIAMARGLDEYANAKRVAIFRQIKGQRMAAAFDLTTIRDGEDDDPEIYRGDIIVVDGSKTRRAWRDTISSLPFASFFVPVF